MDAKTWQPNNVKTELQGIDGVTTRWFMDEKVLIDSNVRRKKEE